MDRVAIRLIDDSDQVVVELEYDILQLDSVVLAEFIQRRLSPLNKTAIVIDQLSRNPDR